MSLNNKDVQYVTLKIDNLVSMLDRCRLDMIVFLCWYGQLVGQPAVPL